MPKIKTLDKYISVNEFCDLTFDGIPEDYKDSFADGMAYMLDLLDKMDQPMSSDAEMRLGLLGRARLSVLSASKGR